MTHMGIALQLYTIRAETEKDFVGSLRKVAQAGYEGVEFAGYGGLAVEELKALLAELNLKPAGSHVQWQQIRNHLDEEIVFHKTLGTECVIVPWLGEEYRQGAGLKEAVAVLNQAGEAFSAAGIGFGYHNHDFELRAKVDGQLLLDAIFAQTALHHVQAELDTAWVHHGGQDASGFIAKYADRLALIHLKDLRVEEGKALTLPLGEGDVPLAAILQAAQRANVHWLVVEQDQLHGRDAFASIQTSREWLRRHYR